MAVTHGSNASAQAGARVCSMPTMEAAAMVPSSTKTCTVHLHHCWERNCNTVFPLRGKVTGR